MANRLKAHQIRRFPGTRAIMALILREMSTTYGRTAGGYIWAVLEPVAAVVLLAVVFAFAFASPPIGNDFPLFYATGYLPFAMYNDISRKMGAAIRFSRPLLAYPSVTFIDALIGRLILNTLTHLMVLALVIGGIIIVRGLNVIIDYGAIAQAIGMIIALSLGVGTLNCYLLHTFAAWEQIWGIANRPLFVLSGILFVIDDIGEPFRSILLLNPIAHPIMELRAGFFVTYDAVHVAPIFVYVFSAVCLFLGLVLLGRYNRYILNEGL